MGFPKVTFRVCETRHCPIFKFGDTFTVSGIAVVMDNNGDSSFINTTVVQSNQQRENCKILNSDLTKIIIEYERADQIPDCLITCSGCTGSIRLEHSRDLLLEEEETPEDHEDVAATVHLLSNFLFSALLTRKIYTRLLISLSCSSLVKMISSSARAIQALISILLSPARSMYSMKQVLPFQP